MAQESIGVREGVEGARIKLRACLDEIEFCQAKIESTEQAMVKFLNETGLAAYLLSIPGVGVVTAAGDSASTKAGHLITLARLQNQATAPRALFWHCFRTVVHPTQFPVDIRDYYYQLLDPKRIPGSY